MDSLTRQNYPMNALQVIVVDDGSTDETNQIGRQSYPFGLVLLTQANLGASQARNYGAQYSKSEIIIFLDDDICPAPEALSLLVERCMALERTVILGRLTTPGKILDQSIFARVMQETTTGTPTDCYIHYTHCKTGLLAIRAQDFFDLEMFQDPTGGWPNWDDVDFGYRAHQNGFRFLECAAATGEHWDYAALDLKSAYNRSYRAGFSAVRLVNKYPTLQNELPMLRDSLPIDLRKDGLLLAGRKVARRAASCSHSMRLLVWLARRIEKAVPAPKLLRPLYRWIIGGYIYQGFHKGLQQS